MLFIRPMWRVIHKCRIDAYGCAVSQAMAYRPGSGGDDNDIVIKHNDIVIMHNIKQCVCCCKITPSVIKVQIHFSTLKTPSLAYVGL